MKIDLSKYKLNSPARILLFDIEATNLAANFGFCLCVGYKWLDEPDVKVISIADKRGWRKDCTDDRYVVQAIQKVMSKADMWVGWYSQRYDVPFIQTRLLFHGLPLLPPAAHIDLWRTCKYRLKLNSNRLAACVDFFGLTAKTPIRGAHWVRAGAGHAPSLAYVIDHCKADILALQDSYLKLRPLVTDHPNVTLGMNELTEHHCRHCGEPKSRPVGFHFCRTRLWRRWKCSACGAYENKPLRSKQKA